MKIETIKTATDLLQTIENVKKEINYIKGINPRNGENFPCNNIALSFRNTDSNVAFTSTTSSRCDIRRFDEWIKEELEDFKEKLLRKYDKELIRLEKEFENLKDS